MSTTSDESNTWVARLLGIDLRSLALFRVGLGLLLLWDLGVRIPSLTAHYTDAGVLPRAVLFEAYPEPLMLSLHALGGSFELQAVLFAVATVAAVALTVGYRTRWATVLSWGLLLSLHVRNPAVLNSGDALLLLLLFWGMLLPLGRAFSVDATRRTFDERQRQPARIFSIAAVGLLLQVCFVYWFTALWKFNPAWHTEATAVYFALSLDRFATGFGRWLAQAPPEVLKMLTRATLGWELLGPLLAFVPWRNGPLRTAVVAGFALFHVGLYAAMALGLFPAVCIVAWSVFLPTWFWDTALPRVGQLLRLPAVRCPRRALDPSTPALTSGAVVNGLATLALCYVAWCNIYTLNPDTTTRTDRLFEQVAPVGDVLNLNQTWRMFAMHPSKDDGWYVMSGTLRSGKRVDVFGNGVSLDGTRPAHIAPTYRDQRWRKYLGNRLPEKKEALGPPLARHLWRRWNRQHRGAERLQRLRVYRMYEENQLGGKATPVERRLVAEIDSSKTGSQRLAGE